MIKQCTWDYKLDGAGPLFKQINRAIAHPILSGQSAPGTRLPSEHAFIKIFNKDELIRSVPVFAAEKVRKVNFFVSLLTSFNYMIWGDA